MNRIIYRSKLKSPLTKDFDKHLFSLADYYNSLFTSNDPKKIMEFYNHFKTNEELIEWMKDRPKGVSYIHEVDGNKDIVVVIPTVDINGKYAKTCKDEIFKGLHIIFVESGVGNYYFNYAHNVNVGIKKALVYNPKWIIVSNDDMYKIDPPEKLVKELSKIDCSKVDAVFTKRTRYHSVPTYIGRITNLYILYLLLTFQLERIYFHKKFNIKYNFILSERHSLSIKALARKYLTPNICHNCEFIVTMSFAIFSSNFFRKVNNYYDETYINAVEDSDISFRLFLENRNYTIIDYKIGDMEGMTFGKGKLRDLRSRASTVYFNYKFQKYLSNLENSNFNKNKL
ncbi:MAG: hypothetical protein M1481_07030 [Candidatus Thermoplasmatota archaeon]|nr:hypothetical protein [Candidatus Thermoplasmatota archaeon]MCL5963227.1 hypothetical protein [Candidatus Thermoplasmatota archaeon]